MRLLFQSFFALGLAGLLVLPAPAQPAAAATNGWPALGLPAARQRAFERNWDLLAARSGVDTATAQLLVAREFPNPALALSTARLGNRENSTPLGNSLWNRSYDSIAAVSQLLEIGGKRSRRQASAQAGVNGARARFFDARRTLEQGVTKAYLAVLLAEENARVLTESAHSLARESGIAEARFHAGDISAADLKQIQNNAAEFDLQARSAEAAAAQARIQVELLLGEPHPAGHWNPVETLPDLAAAPAPVLPGAAPAGAERPDVLAAEADLQRAQADLALQRALRIPDPTVSLQVEHNPPGGGPPTDTAGIGVSFPLPLWNRNGGNIRAAEANRDQAALAARKVRAQALADLALAEITYQEAAARLRRYQEQIRPRAAEVRESVAYAYGKGGASLVALLTAERDDNSVRLATAQAQADTASAAADLAAVQNRLTAGELATLK